MDFKPAKCPSCGGTLQLPVDQRFVSCMYCGGSVVVQDAIHAAAVASIFSLLKLARAALQSRNFQEGYDYFTRVLEADSDNWEAWAGKGEAVGWLAGPQESRLWEAVTCFGNALHSAPPEQRPTIENRLANAADLHGGRYYTRMRASLSPGFAEERYWQPFVNEVRTLFESLEEAHRLAPQNVVILQAILYLARSTHGRIVYVNRFNGARSSRTMPHEMQASIREKIERYSKELEALTQSEDAITELAAIGPAVTKTAPQAPIIPAPEGHRRDILIIGIVAASLFAFVALGLFFSKLSDAQRNNQTADKNNMRSEATTQTANAPPSSLSPEAQAVEIVKKAILTVPGNGRSSMTVEDGIKFFMAPPNNGVSPGKGWSAQADKGNRYLVSYDFIDGSRGNTQAIWSVDLASKNVQYINESAKSFSWIPKD